jgi:hypothetical protein
MRATGTRTVLVVFGFAVVSALVAWYIAGWLMRSPATVAVRGADGSAVVELRLQTVAALGPHYANPTWVSYLVRDAGGEWRHSTNVSLPANSTVRVTIEQYDGSSGLRNPFFAQPQGVSEYRVDGKPQRVVDPTSVGHTFAVPELSVYVPLPGVSDSAPNQCSEAPCSAGQAHHTVTFTFRTGKRGRYRWQCFVPCAAGFLNGFGGPMQTVGYMDGFLEVV